MTRAMRYQTAVPTPSLARLDMQDKDSQVEFLRKWTSSTISKTEGVAVRVVTKLI